MDQAAAVLAAVLSDRVKQAVLPPPGATRELWTEVLRRLVADPASDGWPPSGVRGRVDSCLHRGQTPVQLLSPPG